MLYFKHAELARDYHVSLKTVYNWIDTAKQGKASLELFEHGGRTYIANKQSNVVVLRQLAQEGKKYRNARFHKVLTPKPELYELYSKEQIVDIMTNLRTHGEIPRQYNYFDRGAHSWDERMQRDAKEIGLKNTLKGTHELIHTNLTALDRLAEDYTRVNIIDVGPGNAMPVRELLEYLVDRKLLHRYIAIDISKEMLRIAERNIKEWFGDKVPFEGHVRDIGYERFSDVLAEDTLAGSDTKKTLNLILFLGATPVNFLRFSDPVRTIYGSMDADALFMSTNRIDSDASRRYFEFSTTPEDSKLAASHTFVLELFNITEDLYEPEMGYDEQRRMRYVRIRLKTALTIRLQFKGSEHDLDLEKGSTILVLRVWHLSAIDVINEFKQVGLTLLQSSITKDRGYILTIFGMEEAETRI